MNHELTIDVDPVLLQSGDIGDERRGDPSDPLWGLGRIDLRQCRQHELLDEWSRVKPFADNLKVNYPLLDANNRKDVEDAFGPMWGLPTSVIIGRDGKVAKRHSGIATKEQFKQYVESLL